MYVAFYLDSLVSSLMLLVETPKHCVVSVHQPLPPVHVCCDAAFIALQVHNFESPYTVYTIKYSLYQRELTFN